MIRSEFVISDRYVIPISAIAYIAKTDNGNCNVFLMDHSEKCLYINHPFADLCEQIARGLT